MKYRDFPLRLPTSCSWWNWTSPVTVRSELSGGIDAPQSCFFAYCTAVCISVQRVRTVHSPAVICHGSGAVKICLFYCVSGCQQYLVSHFPHDGFSSSLFFFFFFPTDIPEIPESIKFCKSLEIADFSGNPLSR